MGIASGGAADAAGLDDESLCQRCGRTGQTCCQRTQVHLTRGDIARITLATGRDDFHETVPPADPDNGGTLHLDPLWAATFTASGRTVLRHDAAGNCYFLAPGGCRLSLESRPLVCRLYPFDYTEDCIKGVHAPLCPWPERENQPLLLALLAMSRETAEGWRRLLYQELQAAASGRT